MFRMNLQCQRGHLIASRRNRATLNCSEFLRPPFSAFPDHLFAGPNPWAVCLGDHDGYFDLARQFHHVEQEEVLDRFEVLEEKDHGFEESQAARESISGARATTAA